MFVFLDIWSTSGAAPGALPPLAQNSPGAGIPAGACVALQG